MNVFVLGGKKRHAVERVDQAGGKCLQQVSLFIRLLLDRSHRQFKVYRLHAVNVHGLWRYNLLGGLGVYRNIIFKECDLLSTITFLRFRTKLISSSLSSQIVRLRLVARMLTFGEGDSFSVRFAEGTSCLSDGLMRETASWLTYLSLWGVQTRSLFYSLSNMHRSFKLRCAYFVNNSCEFCLKILNW